MAASKKSNAELGLAALTYIAFNMERDRDVAMTNLQPLFDTYTEQEINRGAMNALAAIIIIEANRAGMSEADYINTLRPLLDHGLYGNLPDQL